MPTGELARRKGNSDGGKSREVDASVTRKVQRFYQRLSGSIKVIGCNGDARKP